MRSAEGVASTGPKLPHALAQPDLLVGTLHHLHPPPSLALLDQQWPLQSLLPLSSHRSLLRILRIALCTASSLKVSILCVLTAVSCRPGKQLPLLEFGPRPPASQSLSTPILLFYSQSLYRGILVSGRPLLRAVLIVDSSGASCYRAAQFHSVRPQVFHLVALCEAVIPFHEADSIHSHKLPPLFGFIIFA